MVTSELCSLNMASSLEVAKSQTLAVLSSDDVTNLIELNENERSVMQDSL